VGVVFSYDAIFSPAPYLSTIYQNAHSPLDGWSVVYFEANPVPKKETLGFPVRLKIPKINVDAFVERVGLTSRGAMDVPKIHTNVAWLETGQLPGESGSAVIAGHYGWKDGKASAFDNLYKLRTGDIVYIEDDQGASVSFVVRKTQRYTPTENASEVFISNDGLAHLNLVTCEGVWNKILQGYSKRLVIFTDKQ
jgi:LPXTG-site transpeptidase (sortase) family protein